ncbi:MAG: 3-oxoacid CoA-transferase subunit B [Alcaligenaceae bacterium]|nr:MAG: 3-oxoacid CoA-transferase subunit B [Alcaligenaceae bacterium]
MSPALPPRDQRLSREEITQLVASDIPDGSVVNLGIGMPTLVSNYLPEDREIILHSENGILGMGTIATGEDIDPDLINASRQPVTLIAGASISEHTVSFAMMRGGHLDIAVLGAFQVAANGDLANWHTGAPNAIPAVGGAMDLAVGAKKVFITTDHVTKQGEPKIVEELTYPVTGKHCVDRVYTDLCVIDVTPNGLKVIEKVEGLSFEELQALTGATLIDATQG